MISVLIPFFNEADNLPVLKKQLLEILQSLSYPFEIIFVNDGSTDNSVDMLQPTSEHVKIIHHRKKRGKGKALQTAYQHVNGDIVVFMDADLQDDPNELPHFIAKIAEGYDFVNGWRKHRHDNVSKRWQSAFGNIFILKLILKSTYHDVNCGFKVMKRQVLDDIPLYGDNFRFLPILVHKEGFKTTEIPIIHHKRLHGTSKYGFFERFSIFADILTMYFIYRFSEKPLHFFGAVGGIFFLVGFIIAVILSYQRIFYEELLFRRPLLLMAVLFMIVGIQVFMTGIIAELQVYFYNKSKQASKKIINS